jgi:hypothetical protein
MNRFDRDLKAFIVGALVLAFLETALLLTVYFFI